MVGVPGKSKGCHTCLKRRVKCDEERPTCKRCVKAGYNCAGYERKLEFRTHSFQDEGKPQESRVKTVKKPATGTAHRSSLLGPQTFLDSVPGCLSLIAFKDDIQFAYLFANFVWSSYGTPWLQLSALGKIDRLSLNACRAFSQTVFGKHYHLKDTEVDGSVQYGRTVRDLSLELSNVGQPGSEALIIPIMILLIYSSTVADLQASMYHAKGLMQVVQICGPARFRDKTLRPAFESCRATLFTIALLTKSRTFLDQRAWRTEPWSCGDIPKSPQNCLVDILIMVPGLLDDEARYQMEPTPTALEDLRSRINRHLEDLHQWRWSWEESNSHSVWEVEPDTIDRTRRPLGNFRVVHKVLCFSSFALATEICLYNAVLLCLLGLLWSLEPPLYSVPVMKLSQGPLNLPGDVCSLYEPAEEICRAFEFQLLHINYGTGSALFWLFPLGLASKVLEDDLKYGMWIKSMLDTSQVTRGYGTGSNAFGFGAYKFPKIARGNSLSEGVKYGMS